MNTSTNSCYLLASFVNLLKKPPELHRKWHRCWKFVAKWRCFTTIILRKESEKGGKRSYIFCQPILIEIHKEWNSNLSRMRPRKTVPETLKMSRLNVCWGYRDMWTFSCPALHHLCQITINRGQHAICAFSIFVIRRIFAWILINKSISRNNTFSLETIICTNMEQNFLEVILE